MACAGLQVLGMAQTGLSARVGENRLCNEAFQWCNLFEQRGKRTGACLHPAPPLTAARQVHPAKCKQAPLTHPTENEQQPLALVACMPSVGANVWKFHYSEIGRPDFPCKGHVEQWLSYHRQWAQASKPLLHTGCGSGTAIPHCNGVLEHSGTSGERTQPECNVPCGGAGKPRDRGSRSFWSQKEVPNHLVTGEA